jgi:hypothetical protein
MNIKIPIKTVYVFKKYMFPNVLYVCTYTYMYMYIYMYMEACIQEKSGMPKIIKLKNS